MPPRTAAETVKAVALWKKSKTKNIYKIAAKVGIEASTLYRALDDLGLRDIIPKSSDNVKSK